MGMVMKDVGDMPWDERSFLWHGHTFDFPQYPRICSNAVHQSHIHRGH